MGNSVRRDARSVAVQQKRQRALKLRLAGKTYDEIGKALGIDKSTAWDAVQSAISAIPNEAAAEVLAQELSRLDRMLGGVWVKAASGDVDAVRAMLAIMARRAKYLGLDAPTKAEHSGPNGGPIQINGLDLSSLSDAQLEALSATNDLRSIGAPALPVADGGCGDRTASTDAGETAPKP